MRRSSWWPDEGSEPDPRWSLANERTLLAYSRTALGLVVAGFAISGSHVVADISVWAAALGVPLIALGAVLALAGERRFVQAQRAMRLGTPMPAPTVARLLPIGIGVIAVVGLVVAIIELAQSS